MLTPKDKWFIAILLIAPWIIPYAIGIYLVHDWLK